MTQFNEYDADGVSRLYAFRFPAFEKSDLLVSLDGFPQVVGWSALGLNGGNGGAVEFETAPVSETVVRIERVKIPPQVAYLVHDENLADIQDKAQARANLGVYSTTQTDDAIAAAAVSVADAALLKAANLNDVADVAQARTNLGVYSTTQTYTQSEVDAALAALELSSGLAKRLAMVERNLAITVLRDQIGFGSSGQKMVNGIADEFEDLSGLESIGDATYHPFEHYIGTDGTPTEVTPDGSVFGDATSYAGLAAAFDGVASQDRLSCATRSADSVYAGKSFLSAQPITQVKVYGSSNMGLLNTTDPAGPGHIYVYGKNGLPSHGTDGTLITDQAFNDSNGIVLTLSTTGTYTHVWVLVTNDGTGYVHFAEIKYYVAGYPVDTTIVSAITTAIPGSTNTEARLILLHQPVDAVTLNTDVTVEASRDGGTTWTAGTLVHEGAFDAATNILSATIDLSGQPAGTAMKWRCKTFNSKEQRLHGVWMQWS